MSSQYLYHITYANRIDSISDGGLQPGRSSNFGNVYEDHSKGRLFLTSFGAARFWSGKLWDQAQHRSDEALEEGLFPVALRVTIPPRVELHVDEEGSRDSRKDAFYITEKIPASNIEIWTRTKWVPIRSVEEWEFIDEAIENTESEEEDGMTLYYYDEDFFIPRKASLQPSAFFEEFRKHAKSNAPLGLPGGPCHIIRDIENESLPEGVKEDLIEDVEKGKDLSNQDADLLYPPKRVPSTSDLFKAIYLTAHAQYRMNLRGVTERELQSAFDEFDRWYQARMRNPDKMDPKQRRLISDLAYGEPARFSGNRSGLTIVFALDAKRKEARLVSCWWTDQPNPPKPKPGQCDFVPYLDKERTFERPAILGKLAKISSRVAFRAWVESQKI